jgi:death-on-curing protein
MTDGEDVLGSAESSVPFVHLTVDDVIDFHAREIGPGLLRNRGALEGAVNRPRTTVFGEDAFPDLFTKAAALLQGVDRAQAFQDGNKRAAWAAMVLFCALNGHWVNISTVDGYELAMSVAQHQLDDVEAIAEALKFYIVRLPDPPDD